MTAFQTRSIHLLLTFTSAAAVASPASDPAKQWNQFRGPGGTGVAEGCHPPPRPTLSDLAWKIPVPAGLSSPVIAGDLVILTGTDNGRLSTHAYHRGTGQPAWQRETPDSKFEPVHATSSPAAPTPVTDDERIYVYFGSYGLLCYDHQGEEVWKKPLETPRSLYGTATSPILHGETLILVVDDDENLPDSEVSRSRVFALDKRTGDTVWETPRPFHRSGWSTPTIWHHASGVDLVVLGNARASGYDPADGSEKWYATGFSRETIAVPVAGPNHIYVSAAQLGGGADEQPDPAPFWAAVMRFDGNGDGRLEPAEMTGHFTYPLRPDLPLGHPGFGFPLPSDPGERKKRLSGIFTWVDHDKDGFWTAGEFEAHMTSKRGTPLLMAIRPGGRGDVTESHVTWQLRRGIPEIPTPIFYEDRIYLIRDGGMLTCVDTSDASTLYRERVGASGGYSASPVIANGQIYLVSIRGTLSVVEAGDQFAPPYHLELDEPAQVTPAVDIDTLYIRTADHLWAFRSARPG